MLHDSQTDLVFLPKALRLHFPRLFKSLTLALETALVPYQEIPHTESMTRLWVRDYMPITVDTHGDLAQFLYSPDYLSAPRYAKYKPNMEPIWEDLGMSPFRYEDIITYAQEIKVFPTKIGNERSIISNCHHSIHMTIDVRLVPMNDLN